LIYTVYTRGYARFSIFVYAFTIYSGGIAVEPLLPSGFLDAKHPIFLKSTSEVKKLWAKKITYKNGQDSKSG
jgi:hypothetical protein